MAYETIFVEVGDDGVAIVRLNRPEVRNALSQRMVDELHHALYALEARQDVRALIVASAGGKAFMSGADIAELRNRRRQDALKRINANLFAHFERFPRPTVAAIVGWCLGGGCELASSCDFRVAGESARFGQPEVGLGIMAAAGGTRRLPELVGLSKARWLLFSGVVIDAAEAERIGLVDRVVPDDRAMEAARELLGPILEQAPEAVKRTKEALQAWAHGATEAELMKQADEIQAALFEHPEKFERMDAFLAKRRKR